MTKKIKKNEYNLPDGFMLHSFMVFQDVGLSRPNINTKGPYGYTDYQLEAKNYIGLPQLPVGYYFSIIVSLVLSEKDYNRLRKMHPTKYQVYSTEEEDCSYSDQELLEGLYVYKPSPETINERIEKYFDINRYKKPVPVGLQYAWCGCYVNGIITDSHEIDNWDDYIYYLIGDFSKVFSTMPLHFSQFMTMKDFLMSIAGQVNEYCENKVLSGDRLAEIAENIAHFNQLLKIGKLNISEVKNFLNPRIKACRENLTIENEFYLRHFTDCLDKLQDKQILKRCQYCDEAFDYNKKKLYCGDKCAKSARNNRSYMNNRKTRLIKARKAMKEMRDYYKSMGVKK